MFATPKRRWAQVLVPLFALSFPVTVASASTENAQALRPTKVVVQCKPGAVNPGETTECTLSVSDTGSGKKQAPVGVVTVTTSGPGSFDATTCTLDPAVTASKCTVRYTPAQLGTGKHLISASYPGSEVHAASSKSVELAVTPPNDDLRAAEPLASPPSSKEGTLVGATYSDSDPEAGCAYLDGTVWYRFTGRGQRRIAIRLQAHGKLDGALAVFQVVRSQYKAVGCSPTDAKGIAGVAFQGARGTRYLVLVGSRYRSARSSFRLELFAPPVARPPGAALPHRGARSAVDPLTKPEEAWWAPLVAGRTYRVNLAADGDQCLSLSVYAPQLKSFESAPPIRYSDCGGYLVFTPGPDGGGRYSFLVEAEGGRGGAQGYRLEVAPATADDTAPGITISNRTRHRGSVSGRGVDVVDLYRFEVTERSNVTLKYQGTRNLRFDLLLVSSQGSRIDCACDARGGGRLRRELDQGEYYFAFRALGRTGGSYLFSLLVREITTTTVTINGLRDATSTHGAWVTLGALVTPSAAVGGPIRLQVDRFDPIEGWQFVRLFHERVGPGGGVSVRWSPPSLGRWRLHAVFRGSLAASTSMSGYAYLLVQSHSTR